MKNVNFNSLLTENLVTSGKSLTYSVQCSRASTKSNLLVQNVVLYYLVFTREKNLNLLKYYRCDYDG